MEFIDSLLLNFVSQETLPTAQMAVWVVLAVLAVLFVIYILRKLTRPRFAGGSRSKKARLAITDAARVDEHGRSVVLLRRDDVEHLLLIGGPNDLVIESNIRKFDADNSSQARSAQSQPTKTATPIAAAAPLAAAAVTLAKPEPTPEPVSEAPAAPAAPIAASAPAALPTAPKAEPVQAVATPKEPILPPPSQSVSAPLAKPAMSSSVDSPATAAPLAQPVFAQASDVRKEPPSFTNSARVEPKVEATAAPKPPTAEEEMEALLSEVELPKRIT